MHKNIIDSIHNLIMTASPSGKIKYLNKMSSDFYGIKNNNVDGRNLYKDLLNLTDNKKNEIIDVLNKKKLTAHVFETTICNKNKEKFTVLWELTGLNTGNGSRSDDIVIYSKQISKVIKSDPPRIISDKLFRLLVESIDDSICFISIPNYKIVYLNPEGTKKFKYSHEEAYNLNNILDLFPDTPMGRQLIIERMQRRMAGEKLPNTFETQLVDKDGKIFELMITSSFVTLNDQSFLILIGKDITTRKQIEKDLKNSETKFRAVVENAKDGIALVNVQTQKFIYINEAAAELSGYTENEIYSFDSFLDVFPDNEFGKSLIINNFKQRLEGNTHLTNYESQIIHKNGDIVNVLLSTSLITLDNLNVIVAIIKDITTQKKIEQELKDSEERFRCVVENAHNGIGILRLRDQKLLYVNKYVLEKTGYSEEEFYSLDITKIFVGPNGEKNIILERIEKRLKGEKVSSEFEVKLKTKSGDFIDILFQSSVAKLNDEDIVIVLAKDITERKILENEKELLISELKRTNEELKSLSKLKDDFIAIANHDLRTPLTNIAGYTQLLLNQDDIAGNPTYKNYLEVIKKNADIQLKYANALLDLINLEHGVSNLNLKKTNIDKLISDCISNNLLLAENKNIKIKLKNKVKDKIKIDADKIEHVLNNLISNAIKFTKSGGKINILSFINSDKEFELHVKDNGIGINKKQMPFLFDRYKRFHTTGTNGEKGSGLGLVISKNIITLHKGKLMVKSNKKGTDFYFILPL